MTNTRNRLAIAAAATLMLLLSVLTFAVRAHASTRAACTGECPPICTTVRIIEPSTGQVFHEVLCADPGSPIFRRGPRYPVICTADSGPVQDGSIMLGCHFGRKR